MYACYNLVLTAPLGGKAASNEGGRSAARIRAHRAIDQFIAGDAVDAAALESEWFGHGDFKVFISHSHADVDLATDIASRMRSTLGLNSFVESTVWGYADDLLRKIDDCFCRSSDDRARRGGARRLGACNATCASGGRLERKKYRRGGRQH